MALLDGMLRRATLVAEAGAYRLSEPGRAQWRALGLAVPEAVPQRGARRFAYPCLDWSERREHLAGSFATALFEHALAHDWLRRVKDSRALTLTPGGQSALAGWLSA